MTILTRKRSIVAKLEDTYGVDSAPTANDVLLVKNPNLFPLEAENVSRDLQTPHFGNSETLLATMFARVEFEMELTGGGVPGKAPAYDSVLQACAFAKTVITEEVDVVVVNNVATVTHLGHPFTAEDVNPKVIISGANEAELNGEHVITIIDEDSYTFPVEMADANGSGPIVCSLAVEYKPVTDNLKSITIHVNQDGVLHKIKGARGTVELDITVKQIPVLKFSFTGLYVSPEDVAPLVLDFSKFQKPLIANTQNTPEFKIFGFSAALQTMTINLSNDVQYDALIGKEEVKILDRKPAGNLVFEAPRIAQKNFFRIAENSESGPLSLTHGHNNGEKITITAPKASIGNPTYQDSNGTVMLSMPLIINPNVGNDDLSILVS